MPKHKRNRRIYLVISQTGTLLSRIIKLFTGAEYNHASISLTPDLYTMYSFGRVNPMNPVWGGFVEESPHWGTFKRFRKTRVVVLAVPVSEKQYNSIQQQLEQMKEERRCYHYNYIGLGLAAFNIPYQHKNWYYCSEFVRDILKENQVHGSDAMEPVVQPSHFLDFPGQQIYCGNLQEFAGEQVHND